MTDSDKVKAARALHMLMMYVPLHMLLLETAVSRRVPYLKDMFDAIQKQSSDAKILRDGE